MNMASCFLYRRQIHKEKVMMTWNVILILTRLFVSHGHWLGGARLLPLLLGQLVRQEYNHQIIIYEFFLFP